MDTSSPKPCPSCGTLLGRDADGLTDGLCPRCLLASSLQSTVSGQPAASTPPPVDEVAVAFPDLEILELIGRGGMGAVYKARQKSLDRLVALKLLPRSLAADTGFAKRFEAEAKALATLNHPNIVTVHEFGHRDDFYFLLMEYVDGPNLRSLLVDHRMSPEEALSIVPRVCEALEFAHRRNVVHCDIKPENLLLNTDGQVKIADFGIARILGQTSSHPDSDKVAGTPAYMAPEQMDRPHAIDTRADIYSLGVVFYEMLTGERPNHELTPPSGKNSSVDVRLDEIVLRALDANPQGRWQSANELNGELQTFLTERLGEPKITPPEKLPKSTPLLAWIASAAALAAILVFVFAEVASEHIRPLPEDERQAAIDRYFEFALEGRALYTQFEALPRTTAAERQAREEIWDQLVERGTSSVELEAVSSPLISHDVHEYLKHLSIFLALIGLVLGLRHLSWLRGREEPLPALRPALFGTVVGPAVLVLLLLLPTLHRVDSLWGNTAAFTLVFLLVLWGVRRTRAWSRNLRHAPPVRVAHLVATALVALSAAVPLTSAQRASDRGPQLAWDYKDSFEDHQLAIVAIQVDFDKEGSGRFFPEAKVKEARDAIEACSDAYQRLTLSNARPFGLEFPKGEDRIMMFSVPPIALLLAVFILWKFRPRRTR